MMKNRVINIQRTFYCIVLFISLCGATIQNNAIKINCLNNCGFLYESKNGKVIVDPFGTEYSNYFLLTPDTIKSKIIEGIAPFENIDLLLITHIHGDHFNSTWAEKFLLKNKKTKMICPRQVSNQMKDSCPYFNKIEPQIISPEIAINELHEVAINNITIMAIRMQHGTNRSLEGINRSKYTDYEKTENFGYVIHFGKKTIFHQGDACLKINIKAINMINHNIDIAHLGYFDWDSESLNIAKKELHANKIIFMHRTRSGLELKTEQFKRIEPQMIIFKKELENKIF